MNTKRKLLSIMIPAYNEENTLPDMYEALRKESQYFDMDCEFLFIDDGSTDHTFELLERLHGQDPRVKAIRLSRNYGSHVGVSVGMDFASGDAAVIVPCDLQDHPREIGRFLEKWREGYHVVWGVRTTREDRHRDVFFSRLFATIMRRIAIPNYPPNGTGSFRLLDRKVVDAMRRYPEHNRMVSGLILTLGFRQIQVPYERGKRCAGESNYSTSKKIKLLIDCVVSFSTTPIRMASLAGFALAGASILYALYATLGRLLSGSPVPGYTSIIVIILMLGGVQLVVLGVLGEYLWRALDDVRHRPLYLVWETRGSFEPPRLASELHQRPREDDCA